MFKHGVIAIIENIVFDEFNMKIQHTICIIFTF